MTGRVSWFINSVVMDCPISNNFAGISAPINYARYARGLKHSSLQNQLFQTSKEVISFSDLFFDLFKVFQKEFYGMFCPSTTQKYCEINGKKYENIKAILSSNETSIDIAKAIAYSAFGKMQSGIKYLTEIQPRFLSETNNNVMALVNKDILSQNPFSFYLQNSSAIRNAPSKKVFIFSLERDSIVSVKNSERYFETFNQTNRVRFQKFPNIQHLVCTPQEDIPVDHNGAEILANIYSLAYINNQTSSMQ